MWLANRGNNDCSLQEKVDDALIWKQKTSFEKWKEEGGKEQMKKPRSIDVCIFVVES